MSTDRDVTRIVRSWLEEGVSALPDRVLDNVLDQLPATRQRRAWWPARRLKEMNTPIRLAIAAPAVVLVALVGINVLPSFGGFGGPPSPTPSPSPTASPTRSSPPSPYVPPALTKTFTSAIHGITISYPAGWVAQPASAPWTASTEPVFTDPAGDFLVDEVRGDHLFLVLASQPISGSFDDWAAALLGGECATSEPVIVDGAEGVIACAIAMLPSGGRGYIIKLYTSGDDASLRAFDADAWLREIVATVQLRPDDAIDTAPSASS